MKTKELIEKVEVMGFECVEDGVERKIITIYGKRIILAQAYCELQFVISTDFLEFDNLPAYEKETLYNILVEYASTPVSEREDEPKYRYRLMSLGYRPNYLFLNGVGVLLLGSKDESSYQKTQFTQSDIDKLTPEQQKLFEIAVRERVDDENN